MADQRTDEQREVLSDHDSDTRIQTRSTKNDAIALTDEQKKVLSTYGGDTCIRTSSTKFDADKFILPLVWDYFQTKQPQDRGPMFGAIHRAVADWAIINDIDIDSEDQSRADLGTYIQELAEEIAMISTEMGAIDTQQREGIIPTPKALVSPTIHSYQADGRRPTTVLDWIRGKPVQELTHGVQFYFRYRHDPLPESSIDSLARLKQRIWWRLHIARAAQASLRSPHSMNVECNTISAENSASLQSHCQPSPITPCVSSITTDCGPPHSAEEPLAGLEHSASIQSHADLSSTTTPLTPDKRKPLPPPTTNSASMRVGPTRKKRKCGTDTNTTIRNPKIVAKQSHTNRNPVSLPGVAVGTGHVAQGPETYHQIYQSISQQVDGRLERPTPSWQSTLEQLHQLGRLAKGEDLSGIPVTRPEEIEWVPGNGKGAQDSIYDLFEDVTGTPESFVDLLNS